MRVFMLCAALLGAVRAAIAGKKSDAAVAFTPPLVFENANLVHIISAEKGYVKESVNVIVENIATDLQSEYFFAVTADKAGRIGAFEARDRKNNQAPPFVATPVDHVPNSPLQYYKVLLPEPLDPGAQRTLGISYFVLDAYQPRPASIAQDDPQFLAYDFSVYCPSAYPTRKQKTEVRLASTTVSDYTRLGDDSLVKKQGNKIVYGPFPSVPAGVLSPATVRFDFTKPVLHVASLRRDIEVSHWGGNVAFEEHYDLAHRGANLSVPFNRAKWAQAQYYNKATAALKGLHIPLHPGSRDAYFTDVVGNVSTSRFHPGRGLADAVLELKPRYPIFGGWRYPFTIGWNIDAKHYVRRVPRSSQGQNEGEGESPRYILSVPFLEGPKQPEGVEYAEVNVRVVLPEGADNVQFYTSLPLTALAATTLTHERTYLDTQGRTVLSLRATRLVDALRSSGNNDEQQRAVMLFVAYDYAPTAALRKPLVVAASAMAVFMAAWAVGHMHVGFRRK